MFFVLGRLVSGFLGCEVIKRESKLLSRCEKGRHYCFRLPCWAASLESAHAWTVQNDRDVPCTVSHWRLMAVRVSKVPSCDLRPYQLRIICVRCKLWMLWPYSAILGASTPPASPAINSYYLFVFLIFLFHLILFHSFSTKVALGSRWPPTLGQRHCPWHRPCQDTMRAHGHAGKCTINMVA